VCLSSSVGSASAATKHTAANVHQPTADGYSPAQRGIADADPPAADPAEPTRCDARQLCARPRRQCRLVRSAEFHRCFVAVGRVHTTVVRDVRSATGHGAAGRATAAENHLVR